MDLGWDFGEQLGSEAFPTQKMETAATCRLSFKGTEPVDGTVPSINCCAWMGPARCGGHPRLTRVFDR